MSSNKEKTTFVVCYAIVSYRDQIFLNSYFAHSSTRPIVVTGSLHWATVLNLVLFIVSIISIFNA